MLNLHLPKDRGAIVRHRDFTIGGYENLVQASRCESEYEVIENQWIKPRGPRDVRMMLATVRAARICDLQWIRLFLFTTQQRSTLIASTP